MANIQQIEKFESQLSQYKKFVVQSDAATKAIALNNIELAILREELSNIESTLNQVATLVQGVN